MKLRMARWLDEQQVDYLVVFAWIGTPAAGRKTVLFKPGQYSPESGGENMWFIAGAHNFDSKICIMEKVAWMNKLYSILTRVSHNFPIPNTSTFFFLVTLE
jgi:hypothetical protein